MGGAVFPPCCLTWGQTMVELMKIMAASFNRSHACASALSAPDPAPGHHRPTPLLETPEHSRASLGQCLLGSLLLSPGSWCAKCFVYSLQESVFPDLCKLWWFCGGINGDLLQEGLCHSQVCCTQSPSCCGSPLLTHTTRTTAGDTQTQFWLSLCGVSGSWCTHGFVCALQESVSPVLCKFLQLYDGVNGDFLQEGLCHTQVCCTQSLCPCSRRLLTRTSTGDTQTLKGRSQRWVWLSLWEVFWCTQGFVWALQASLVGIGFDSKCDFIPPAILLGLLLCPWMWGIFFGGIKHSPVGSWSAVSCNFGVLAGEDECTSFYSAILLQNLIHRLYTCIKF